MSQFLTAQAELSTATPSYLQQHNLWLEAYEHLWRTRLFDQRAIALQRTGQLGTYASYLGQEAISTAIGFSLQADDIFIPFMKH